MSGSLSPQIQAYSQLLQVPLFGLLLFGFIKGWFVTGKEHDRVIAERDKEREERIKAQDALTTQVMPTLRDTQNALTLATRAFDRFDYEPPPPPPVPRKRVR